MKVIIIDDENKARRLISTLIAEQCPDISEQYEASDLESGVALIKEHKPDIVFLDIEMPKYSGLQIAEFFEPNEISFQIIFITAYNEYAVQAFKLSAVDYILKPIDVTELKNAIVKAQKNIDKNSITDKLDNLKKVFQQLSLNKMILEVPKGILFVSHDDIVLFEADGMYTKVYMKNSETQLICKPLKHFVDQLEDKPIFYKPHRSYLLNLKYMKELSKKDGFHIVMENNKTIPIAKDKKDEFLEMIQDLF
ncbi:response regulator [Flavobacterium cauense R2A-7]|uniref:LytTR family two component transcriptional regulator n=1 Tax=Flavobacterium cauense R2A-7 TaxID=1341154 RepID=V6SBP6_9FLAO|nr:LytTR family DNA-binding domain-containing protein [Flavobacterium cauense]ESU21820.1 response regulator [Flavobacterium cauense R2A-7]KGO81051.1 histidine kinase [Flavobacterium cauense R2A-7]TWI12965.1 LytTR family two component transcriptional regulator [Flavobacterium cauense R2A-7]